MSGQHFGRRLLLLTLIAGAVAYVIAARNIPLDPWSAAELINSRTLPSVYGCLLVLVLLVLFFLNVSPAVPRRSAPALAALGRAGGLCVLAVMFVLMLPYAGLWISLGALLGSSSYWLGERRWQWLLAISLLIPLAGYAGVERLLGVYLPD